MNANPVEEAGQTARSVVTGLSTQPVLLFLLFFILVVLGLFAWAGKSTRDHYDKLYEALFANQDKILNACNK